LADLAKGRLRPKIPALREALTHRFRLEHHGALIAQMLAHIDVNIQPRSWPVGEHRDVTGRRRGRVGHG
jgi:hypothetical protein